MKITVDYEECNGCEYAPDCELLKIMQDIVNNTVEVLREMTGATLPQHEVHN
jgi:hypothetical protein